MTGLLVSVRDIHEAKIAWQHGIEIVDLKDPHHGALAPVSESQLRKIVTASPPGATLSIALGELMDSPKMPSVDIISNFRYAKLGLAHAAVPASHWRAAWQVAMQKLPSHIGRVAVSYVDWRRAQAPSVEEVFEFAVQSDCAAVLLDTYIKDGKSLLDFYGVKQLTSFVASVKSAGMQSVLAGSLTLDLLGEVIQSKPNYIAVRGGVCRNSRRGTLDEQKLLQWKESLSSCNQLSNARL